MPHTILRRSLLLLLLVVACLAGNAQTASQPNIGFEDGNLSNWTFFVGSCCPLVAATDTTPVPGRHELMSGAGIDEFGGFPIVAPGGGNYSFKLGNRQTGGEAERARYYVHVPASATDYSIIYHYAVVFEDPQHLPEEQPRFVVNTTDSATGDTIPCAQFLYIASSDLPGFQRCDFDSFVFFHDWTSGSINLSGYGGRTIIIDFSTGDCALLGHFGYGYIDISEGRFAISTDICNVREAVLSGPPGFHDYYWYDAGMTQVIDSGAHFHAPNPGASASYAVVIQPYPGYGCPDTLYTTIVHSELDMTPVPDGKLCNGVEMLLEAKAWGNTGPLAYTWSPAAGVNCATCPTVTIKGGSSTAYVVRISDTAGCNISDTAGIELDTCALTIPSAFTPNQDGLNEIFRVIGIGFEYYVDFKFYIFNRWGQCVFYTENIYNGWDGIFNGIPQDMDVYFYMVTYTLGIQQHMLKGDVTLVR